MLPYLHYYQKRGLKGYRWQAWQDLYIYGTDKEEIDSITNLPSVVYEFYLAIKKGTNGTKYAFNGSTQLHKPNFWSPYDFSQSYYNFNFGNHITQGSIIIDFGGATEFTEMDPQPDKITMSSIIFNDYKKIQQISKNGLIFHVKFKHMDNYQIIRMFLITSLLGFSLAAMIGCLWRYIIERSNFYLKKRKEKSDGMC